MNLRSGWRASWLLPMLWLAGCSGHPQRPAPPIQTAVEATAEARQAEASRRAWLQARPDWGFRGRVAIRRGRDGGSGRVDWRQLGTAYEVGLSAPVTRQSWRLQGDANRAGGRLEGLEGGPREGGDAQALLREATGWEIPVGSLSDWVRGMEAAGAAAPEESLVDGQGRLRRLRQAGWSIEYREWSDAPGEGLPPLPRLVEADNGQARVRLLVDGWEFDRP